MERRTAVNLFRSFDRYWIFLIVAFQVKQPCGQWPLGQNPLTRKPTMTSPWGPYHHLCMIQ